MQYFRQIKLPPRLVHGRRVKASELEDIVETLVVSVVALAV